MPERRKMKSPSPKMTSTPKMKRKDRDRESPTELQTRLGIKEKLTSKKDFSQDSIDLSDYNDGTTRPMFKKRLRNVSANSGELAQLECVVSGTPPPKVLWLKNNRPLKAADGCKVIVDEGTNILVFPSARDEDVGVYTARAMNVNGSVMATAEFTLNDGKGLSALSMTDSPLDMDFTTPTYFFQMSSCEVSEGRLARFDCRVVAYPKPEIVWMKDGKVVESDGRSKLLNFNNEIYSLLIQDVHSSDTGRYICWARNKFGEAMTEAYLNVIALTEQEEDGDLAPKFLTKFYDQQTTEGTATDFNCLVAGRPEPSVTWFLEDKELRDVPGTRLRRKDNTVSLEMKSPKVDQSGMYSCQLRNPLGEATCCAKLTVIEDKLHGKMLPKFLKKFDHVNARDGEEVKFTCIVIGEPKPEVTWMFDHKPVSDTNRRYVMKKEGDAFTLIIKNVRFDDGGTITCKATNTEGEVYCSGNLHVRESKFTPETAEKAGLRSKDDAGSKFGYVPTFTKRLHDMEVKEGSRAKFECQVMGIPEPEVSWMRDGRVITPGGRYHMTREGGTCRLTIDNTSPADTGVYTCIIANSQGKSSSTAELKLEGEKKERYTPEKFLDDKTFKKERYTPDKYLLDDSYTSPSKRPYLDIDRKEDDMRRFVDLPEMRAPPRLPTHRPLITDLGEETVRLAWRPVETYQSKRSPPVSYRLEAKELPGKDWMPLSNRLRDTTHYLSELPHDRDYMIRVRAENDFGISEPTEPLWLPRAKAFPGVPVTRPEIIDYEANRAKLSWTRVDIPTFGLDDVPLTYMLEVEEPSQDWRTVARDLDDTEYIVEGLKLNRDYRFRVRAKTPTGLISEPSPAASLYTTMARTRAPVDKLEVLEYEPDMGSVHLSWQRVEIPPYNLNDEPLMYMLEYNEPPLPDWKPLVTGIPTTRYRVSHLDATRDYNFRVRALTPYGMSPPSPALPVTLRKSSVVPALPESVIISEVEPDSVRLTWRRPLSYDLSTPISYQIEMLEPPMSEWRPVATGLFETTYKVTGLRPTKDYQFRVMPQVDSRFLAPTSVAALTSSAVKPRLPMSEPSLKEISPESVQLSWRPAEFPIYQRSRAPLYYGVQMMELPSSKWVPVARRVPDTTYTVTGLRPDRDYKFRILAETDVAASEPSLPASLYRKPVPRFQRNEPSIRDISPNVVHLTWQPADIADGYGDITYRVEIQTPPGISTWSTLYDRHPTASVRLADLRPDLDYLVRVRAQCGDHLTEPTLPVYIPRRAVPPRIPLDEPYAVEINSDSVKLQWRSADLPTHILDYAPVTYRLEACEQPGNNWVTVAHGIPHTDFKVTGLNPAKDYTFRVRAMNDYGMSDPTHGVSIPRRSVAPTLPRDEPLMYDIGSGSVRLTWRPATLPSHMQSQLPTTYTIYVQELPFKTWRPLVKKIPHTSYYVSGLRPDKDYNFRIQAENTFGSSRPTESVYLPKFTDLKRPISIPEVSDFDEDLTSVKLHWKRRGGSPFDKSPHKYLIETWEPMRREWKPVARQIPDTSYHMRGLPAAPDHLFRVRMETEQAGLSEPSLPVSVSRYNNYPRVPVYRPQLYEVDRDTVRLSWQPATYIPDGTQRRSFKYSIEQREIPDTHWHQIVSDLHDTNYKIRSLRPKSDYEFRVRTIVDGVASEPSFPVALYRRSVIPRVKLDIPEVDEIDDTSVSLRWNKVEIPSFTATDEPLSFMIERQHLPHYQWEQVATNITDSKYTIRGLQPHQDYNFRVRGVYPSGYTEPSPYVPVYRRPSESQLGVFGLESRNVDEAKSSGSQKYSSKILTNQSLPSHSLRSSLPSEYSPIHRISKQSRLTRSYTPSPKRSQSVSEIYDTIEKSFTEAPFRKAEIPETKFKIKDAYVYNRDQSPVVTVDHMKKAEELYRTKPSEVKRVKFDDEKDFYERYRRYRRHSDAGIENLRRAQSESRFDRKLQERRNSLILESHRQTLRKISTKSTPKSKVPPVTKTSETGGPDPSVADRYEDIKCPHIITPGRWKYPKRRSISLDTEDYERLRASKSHYANLITKTSRTRTDLSDKGQRSKTDLDLDYKKPEYYDGTYFIIEDEVNMNDMTPHSKVSRVDMRVAPYQTRRPSHDKNAGYFLVSKFSLTVSGVMPRRLPTRKSEYKTHIRPVSLEPSPVVKQPVRTTRPQKPMPWLNTRSMTPDLSDSRDMSRSKSVSKALDLAGWEALSKSITEQLEKAEMKKFRTRTASERSKRAETKTASERSLSRMTSERSRASMTSERSSRISPSPVTRKSVTPAATPYRRSRSNSISVSSEARPHFNRLIENSKSIVNNYEDLEQKSNAPSRAASVARSVDKYKFRSMSVADIRSDPSISWTPRASVSSTQSTVTMTPRGSVSGFTPRGSVSGLTPRGSVSGLTPRGSMSGPSGTRTTTLTNKPTTFADVKTDPRFSTHHRASASALPGIRSKSGSVADLRSDPRFSSTRRATVSAATNEDLRSKLDTLTSKLSIPKPKVKKSSRPVMKYKSSRGVGVVTEDTWVPRSDKLSYLYHGLKT